MFYIKRQPPVPLRESVEYFWYLADAPAHATERIVPTGSFELVFILSQADPPTYEPFQPNVPKGFSGAVATGPFDRYFIADTRHHASIMGVHFRPGGAVPALGVPADEIGASHVDLEAIWGTQARRMRERLCEAGTTDQRFDIVAEYLMARILHAPRLRGDVQWALEALNDGTASISRIAEEIGLSHRRFIEVFTAQVGATPKVYARIQRFRRAMRMATGGRFRSWGELAQECGYYDQSHMIRDFQTFAGLSPVEVNSLAQVRVKDDHIACSQGSDLSNTSS